MNLKKHKRMASEILGVGVSRVWIDPEDQEKVEDAITKRDIKNLIESGTIKKKPKKGTRKGRARKKKEQKNKGRKKGHGRRKGKKGARKSEKDEWKDKIRALRKELKRMRDEGEISQEKYRELYRMAKGGYFRNKKHLKLHVQKGEKE